MSQPERTATVPEACAGLRLDQALAAMFPEFSRSRLKRWLQEGAILVDGQSRRPRDTVLGGESVRVTEPPAPEQASPPQPMALDIAYEDESLLVINKPAGLVVHPGAGNPSGTLMNGLLHYARELAELPRAGIVHRLDKDTSGLLLIGRTLESHTALVRLLAERAIERHYDAVCVGVLTGGGTIDAPIRRHRVDRLRMAVHDEGKPAVTHYRVARRFRAHTHVRVRLETGRTHQIRVHFAWRRHPLVGDPLYGGRLAVPAGASDALRSKLRGFRRQALCATRLSFDHPTTGARIDLRVDPDDDFSSLLDLLAADA